MSYTLKTTMQSIQHSVYNGTIKVFDLTNYTEPTENNKNPFVKDVRFSVGNFRWFGNTRVPIKKVNLTFAPDDSVRNLFFSCAIPLSSISQADNDIDALQIRIKNKSKKSNLYMGFLCKREKETSAIQAKCGFTKGNEKIPYNGGLSQGIATFGNPSTSPDLNNYAIGVCKFTHDNGDYYAFYFINPNSTTYSATMSLEMWTDFPDYDPDVEKEDDDYGDYSGSGGYGGGSYDNSSDPFGVPDLPSIGVTDTGFINVYNPSKNVLEGFAEDLFPDWIKPTWNTNGDLSAIAENISTVGDVLGDFVDRFINENLINYVIDCHIVPVVPNAVSNNVLKVGFKSFDYQIAKVVSDYVSVDCGSLTIPEYYQNFLDYQGTRAKLFLPFIGFVDIKPEWFQSGRLHVAYHFNVIDGSCVAYVLATSSKSNLLDTVVGSFGGNCCMHIPITGVNYSSMISGVVSNASAGVTNLLTGNVSGALSNTLNALQSKPTVQQSNGFSGASSFMGIRIPYLLIERPVASFSEKYPSERGMPLNATYNLNSLKGFTVCDSPVLNFKANEEEKEMIKNLLESGVIL